MHNKYANYIYPCLASSGLVVLDPVHAFASRPDIFPLQQDAFMTLNIAEIERDLRARCKVILLRADGVPCAARSLDIIEARIEWVTGKPVQSIEVVETFAQPVAAPAPVKRDESSLPPHPCNLRRRMLQEAQS